MNKTKDGFNDPNGQENREKDDIPKDDIFRLFANAPRCLVEQIIVSVTERNNWQRIRKEKSWHCFLHIEYRVLYPAFSSITYSELGWAESQILLLFFIAGDSLQNCLCRSAVDGWGRKPRRCFVVSTRNSLLFYGHAEYKRERSLRIEKCVFIISFPAVIAQLSPSIISSSGWKSLVAKVNFKELEKIGALLFRSR